MMKCLALVFLLSVSASRQPESKKKGKTLMEVYGERPPVSAVDSGRMKRRMQRTRKAACDFDLNVIFVQDCTSTMADDWPVLIDDQLPRAINETVSTYPGSRFASLLFQDKPVEPMGISPTPSNGYYADFCVRTDGFFHDTVNETLDMYRQHTPYGGGDVYESQFVSLLAASQLPFDWSEDAVKLAVIITDAPPHFDLDGFNPGLESHTDTYDQQNPEGQCKTQYYPSPDQVKSSVNGADLYVGAIAYESGSMNSLVSRSWEWFVRHLGEPDAFLQIVDQSSAQFAEKFALIVDEVRRAECGTSASTTRAPLGTTSAPTLSRDESTDLPSECPVCPTGCVKQFF